jgi:hypothetical protein
MTNDTLQEEEKYQRLRSRYFEEIKQEIPYSYIVRCSTANGDYHINVER